MVISSFFNNLEPRGTYDNKQNEQDNDEREATAVSITS